MKISHFGCDASLSDRNSLMLCRDMLPLSYCSTLSIESINSSIM